MQLVLNYSPMQVGLAFLPANLIMAALSLGLSARMMRWGFRLPLAAGLGLAAAGLALFADPTDSGLASGVVNTSFMMGGALGLAVLASLAAARTEALQAAGAAQPVALNGGYQLAFAVGALFALVAAGLGAWLMRTRMKAAVAPGPAR